MAKIAGEIIISRPAERTVCRSAAKSMGRTLTATVGH
jgi:hypothetical protein